MGLSNAIGEQIRGYVVFRAAGRDLAGFVNMASRHGVELRALKRLGPTVAVARVTAGEFRRLRRPARLAGVSVRIARRGGLPFLWARLAHRPGLLAGFGLALVTLLVLSSRIWAVEVTGVASPEAMQKVEQALATLGVRPGVAKSELDVEILEHDLLRLVPELAWVDVRLVGSVAVLDARSRRNGEAGTLQSGDIVATADGLVTQVVVGAGWPVVRTGDVVRRGQVLISGRPVLPFAEGKAARAMGSVVARVWSAGYADVSEEMPVDRPTGRSASGLWVRIGPWRVALGAVDPPFRRFRTVVLGVARLPGPARSLPVEWEHIRHDEMESARVPLDPEAARRLAWEAALERALEALGPNPQILQQRVELSEEETGGGHRIHRARAMVEALEEIGAFSPHPGAP